MSLTLSDFGAALSARRPATSCWVLGVTGAVAVGKSTFAEQLQHQLSAAGGLAVERVGTDGFLKTNARLEAEGILDRKGFPETFDAELMAKVLGQARQGSASVPGYSHTLYDIDPGLERRIERPDILIMEGLGFGSPAARAPVDALIYLHAAEAVLEHWYVDRFLGFWRAAELDPASFYARFRSMDEAAVRDLAVSVWRNVNLPNWREHIAPLRDSAEIVIEKGPDHEFVRIDFRL